MTSANRLLVHKTIAAEFAEKLVKKVQALTVGPGLDKSVTQGPLINNSAVLKVEEHVKDAVQHGAEIRIGGARALDKGFYFQPTVLTGVDSTMLVAREETFGPLAPIFTFESEAEAIELANNTEFGLAGYFFSQNVSRVLRVAKRLQTGMIGVNTGKISAPEAPFGGIKESGYGREGSLYGMDEYQVIKTVTIGNMDR